MTSIFFSKLKFCYAKFGQKNSTYYRMRFWPQPGRPGPDWAPWPGPSPRSTASTRSSKRQRRRIATATATAKTTESHNDEDDGSRRQSQIWWPLVILIYFNEMCRKYKHVTYDVWLFLQRVFCPRKGAAGDGLPLFFVGAERLLFSKILTHSLFIFCESSLRVHYFKEEIFVCPLLHGAGLRSNLSLTT